jgi:hypothetical protein
MGYAIDVSHHQAPGSLPWASFAGRVDAVIARASYGSGLRDRHCVEHCNRARAIGAKVGVYHFYRPHQPVSAQWDLLRSQCDYVGLREGDIVPALDVEHDPIPAPGASVTPDWSAPAQELAALITATYGSCLVYITQREWGMLGRPQWVLDCPLWVAHYTGAATPATPGGRPAVMWQHRVGPFVHNGPGGYVKEAPVLDQNRILGELPLIAKRMTHSYVLATEGGDDDAEWDELRDRVAVQQFDLLEMARGEFDPETLT